MSARGRELLLLKDINNSLNCKRKRAATSEQVRWVSCPLNPRRFLRRWDKGKKLLKIIIILTRGQRNRLLWGSIKLSPYCERMLRIQVIWLLMKKVTSQLGTDQLKVRSGATRASRTIMLALKDRNKGLIRRVCQVEGNTVKVGARVGRGVRRASDRDQSTPTKDMPIQINNLLTDKRDKL